jgi:2'-5' RNA ligase
MSTPEAEPAEAPITIGVSIAIPEPHASVLFGWRKRIGDIEAENVPPHVTLLPPTQLVAADVAVVTEHLEQACNVVRPFTMKLSGTGTFRPVSPVVFVAVSAGIAECELLERAIRRGPISRDLEFPYHPHVTVGHHVDDESLDEAFDGLRDYVAQFSVDHFTLYSQDSDGAWHVEREFPLVGQ